MASRFVGRGWSFPLATDATGSIALSSDDRNLQQAIYYILATAPGERPMRPEFGCGIHNYVFAPADASTAGRLALEVRKSLRFWEPRIEVQEVEVSVDDVDRNAMYIDIRYTTKGTYDRRNLVFPFYVIPEEE
jgi:phage baseplate assembly protein W